MSLWNQNISKHFRGQSMSMVRAFIWDSRDKHPSLCFLTLLLTRQVPTSTILEWVFPVWPETLLSAFPAPLFIPNCIFLWCNWISGNLHILTESCCFDRSVLSDNQVSTPLSNVVKFTVGFSHWNRIYANHRIRIVWGFFPSQRPLVLGIHLIEYCFLDKAWPGSNNHSIINGSEYRDNVCYFGYRSFTLWSSGPAHSFNKFIPFLPKLK